MTRTLYNVALPNIKPHVAGVTFFPCVNTKKLLSKMAKLLFSIQKNVYFANCKNNDLLYYQGDPSEPALPI